MYRNYNITVYNYAQHVICMNLCMLMFMLKWYFEFFMVITCSTFSYQTPY